jgi:hypothetical protein
MDPDMDVSSIQIAKVLEGADRKRRVMIIERRDGAFELVVQKWRQTLCQGQSIAEGWASLPAHKSIYETVEIAEREARKQFQWLS